MSQAKLVDFAGRLSELAEDHRRILDAVDRSRSTAAYYQADATKQREALRLLKGELIRQHQGQIYRSNEGKFAALRRQIYEHFCDVVFPNWDPAQAPDGIYYHDAFLLAQKEAWGARMNEATYRRRWNELADKRVTNPPLLEWKKPGYYVLAQLEGSR